MIIIVNIVIFILALYLSVYIIYKYVLLASAYAFSLKHSDRAEQYSAVERNLSVIVYTSKDVEKALVLINNLMEQDYPKDKFVIHVVVDNNDPEFLKVLELVNGVSIWKINNQPEPIGMFPSIIWLLNNISSDSYTNGYIFLNETNLVRSNFLSKVNLVLDKSDIAQCYLATASPYLNIFSTIGYINNRINNRIINAGLYNLGFSCKLMFSGLILSQDFLEKYPLQIQSLESESDYHLKLSIKNVKVHWGYEAIVYEPACENLKSLAYSKAEPFYKYLITFKNNFRQILSNKYSISVALLAFYPPRLLQIPAIILLFFLSLLSSSTTFSVYMWFGFICVLILGTIISDLLALIISRARIKDVQAWLVGSLFVFQEAIYMSSFLLQLHKYYKYAKSQHSFINSDEKMSKHNLNTQNTFDVSISDGKKQILCKLEASVKEGNCYLVLYFKDKKFTTKPYSSIDQAFEELNKKFAAKNLKIITCYNCGYFNYSNQSHSLSFGANGHCFFDKDGQYLLFDEVVKIWHVCDNYIPMNYRTQVIELWKNSLQETNTSV